MTAPEVGHLAQAMQAATGESVNLAYVDQGYTGERAAEAAREHGIELGVVRLPEAKRGFVLLPRRWVAERTFAWTTRFRRTLQPLSPVADAHHEAVAEGGIDASVDPETTGSVQSS